MAVSLDDGRSVGFDIKDYRAVDYGYAATIHKSQGVTVDRVHVLATPGLDRHAAYVALSRHRDAVQLHYGGDDFADEARLVRALSRERGKDMASDYPQDPAISRPPQEAPMRRSELASAPMLPAAVERHGRIVQQIQFSQSVGDATTPEQKAELAASRAALNAIQPLAALDLESAMGSDRALIAEAAKGRTAAAIRAMQLEAEMRGDPALRANVFVQRWQQLEQQRRAYGRYQETSKIASVEKTMLSMAKSLERDPQVESILRSRKVELGLPPITSRNIGQALGEMIGRGRSLGLGR